MSWGEKQQLRERMLVRLGEMTALERSQESEGVVRQIICCEKFRRARVIYGYAPMGYEPNWLGAWGGGKVWAFPRCEGEDMNFYEVRDIGELRRGGLGVAEPVGGLVAPAPDLVFVPGLAFDVWGWRLGRGKGFYDRFLAGCGAYRLGLAFLCQVVNEVPREGHDQRVEGLVTVEGWREFG